MSRPKRCAAYELQATMSVVYKAMGYGLSLYAALSTVRKIGHNYLLIF